MGVFDKFLRREVFTDEGVHAVKVSRNLLALLTLLMVVGLVLAACGGSTTTTTAGTSAATVAPGGETTTSASAAAVTVKIGAAGPYTGDVAKIGTDALQAITMAVEDYNASGKGGGITFAVEVGDDGADPAKAATVAEKFAADASVVGVVGTMTSAAVQAALPILDGVSLAEITQSATNDKLSQGGYTIFHRICPTDGVQGPSIAQFLVNDLKVTSVFLIDDKGTYGQGLADQIEKGLKAGGITKIQRAQIATGDKDFSAVLTKVKAMNPSILFTAIPSPAMAAAIAKQMKSMGFQVQMMGGDGMKDKTELITNAGGATEGMYATSLGPLPEKVPAAKSFLDKYMAKYKVTSLFTAQSYEAANIMMDAVVKAGVQNGKVDRKAVNDALSATNTTGILGFPISFTPQGDLKGGGIYIVQVKGADFVPVSAITLAPPFAPKQ
jgi:branched-chain amino acid transport system substrate-binding protein